MTNEASERTPAPVMIGQITVREARRQFMTCNGCRICHTSCSVFPAMEARRKFAPEDVAYLANLCHDCRQCLPLCPFVSKNDRSINVPALMATVRTETYAYFARPRALWRLLARPHVHWILSAVSLVVFAALALTTGDGRLTEAHNGAGSLYEIIAYGWLVALMSVIMLAVLVAGVASGRAFWRETGATKKQFLDARAHLRAVTDVLRLRNLEGGGRGYCHYPGEQRSPVRRRLHFMVFYGFLATFAATVSAAFEQDVLGIEPPYPLLSVPVVLGTLGGIALVIGCVGFLVMGTERRDTRKVPQMRALDRAFTSMLLAVAVTGLATLAVRSTAALGVVLLIHLGTVGGLFLTLPYGKLVHALYRYLALVRFHAEGSAKRARIVVVGD